MHIHSLSSDLGLHCQCLSTCAEPVLDFTHYQLFSHSTTMTRSDKNCVAYNLVINTPVKIKLNKLLWRSLCIVRLTTCTSNVILWRILKLDQACTFICLLLASTCFTFRSDLCSWTWQLGFSNEMYHFVVWIYTWL